MPVDIETRKRWMCTLALALGSSYVLGGDLEHARLAAVFDGLLADDGLRDRVLSDVVEPLRQAQETRDRERRRESESTVVDFFTLAREHG